MRSSRCQEWEALCKKRADVFADPLLHGDGESAVAGDIEMRARAVRKLAAFAIEHDRTFAGHDLHPLRHAGSEMINSRIDQPQSLLFAGGKQDRVRDHAPVEIDVG